MAWRLAAGVLLLCGHAAGIDTGIEKLELRCESFGQQTRTWDLLDLWAARDPQHPAKETVWQRRGKSNHAITLTHRYELHRAPKVAKSRCAGARLTLLMPPS